eukprot:SM000040S14794  [mRNA]  locus=s40:342980:344278:- [translate_table: standard]
MTLEAEDDVAAAAAAGSADAEAYLLTLPDVGLSLRLTLRAAPPALRRRSNSYVHFSVELVSASGVRGGISSGVLAQYLRAALNHDGELISEIPEEGESIEPLSQGGAAASDYRTTGALDTDCIVCVFERQRPPLITATPIRSYHELTPEGRAEVDHAIAEAMAAYAVYSHHATMAARNVSKEPLKRRRLSPASKDARTCARSQGSDMLLWQVRWDGCSGIFGLSGNCARVS